jgi:hypothetical protein
MPLSVPHIHHQAHAVMHHHQCHSVTIRLHIMESNGTISFSLATSTWLLASWLLPQSALGTPLVGL